MKYFRWSDPSFILAYILLILISFFIVYSCGQSDVKKDQSGKYIIPENHEFVGDQTCQKCHADEWKDWQGSHHDYAIGEANEDMVRADFGNITFRDGKDTYRFFREDDKYLVEAPGPEGNPEVYEVAYTFGWEPLQQYLVDFGKGKYQALHVAWDTEQERWFSLYPNEDIEPGTWMHWTGQSMNWNTMCANCHSTNLKQNYMAEADSFHTTWDAINVSCEACHGPGGDHVNFMNSEEAQQANPERIREDLHLSKYASQTEEISTCAPCHSRREKLTDDYIHGDDFLDHFDPALPRPSEYFADGKIKDEVYVYGSFLQSKMYTNHVQCTDCHSPHTLELKEPISDNELCMNCHESSYNSPKHHFHKENTKASQCVNCHMTGRTFMGNDYRRDHSFRVPRPDLSAEFDTPNACNNCHSDQSAEWSARAIENWYGPDRSSNYQEKLTKAHSKQVTPTELNEWINDNTLPELIRATLIWHAGQSPNQESAEIFKQALKSEQPLIRTSAVKAMGAPSSDIRQSPLKNALRDSIRVVQLSALQRLVEFNEFDTLSLDRDYFTDALQEYKIYLDINEYFPQGQMNRGQFFEQQGKIEKAIKAYHKTLDIDPGFNPARINLAFIYNRQGNNEKAEQLLITVIEQEPEFGQAYYSLGLLLAEEDRLQEAIKYFKQASELMPEHSRLFYNWAISLQTLGRPQKAKIVYQKAIELDPENVDYRYGITTLYMQQEQYKKAHKQATILDSLDPNSPQIQQLLQVLEQRMK